MWIGLRGEHPLVTTAHNINAMLRRLTFFGSYPMVSLLVSCVAWYLHLLVHPDRSSLTLSAATRGNSSQISQTREASMTATASSIRFFRQLPIPQRSCDRRPGHWHWRLYEVILSVMKILAHDYAARMAMILVSMRRAVRCRVAKPPCHGGFVIGHLASAAVFESTAIALGNCSMLRWRAKDQ